MKAIMVMFDSLNRHMLPSYGCLWTKLPNFKRLAERTVQFDNCFVGSMPCIPARRELHTGRYNFLHRSWSPLEPFDDSAVQMMGENGVYTHLISDHTHYWEDGGATYHTRYSSFEFFRGQEGDKWKPEVKMPEGVQTSAQKALLGRANAVNRHYMQKEEDHSQAQVFRAAASFLDVNHDQDRWFLHVEPFDPHEPFFSYPRYQQLYNLDDLPDAGDWPDYGRDHYTPEEKRHFIGCYAALLSMCDHYLGIILDKMDQYNLWDDTMLIVNTDHGFLLGEHDYWGKNAMPFYNECAHIPLFIWDPRCGCRGQRRKSLVQTIDLPVTLLDYFGVAPAADMMGRALTQVLAGDECERKGILFGIYGGHVCCTDGKYLYMRGAADQSNKPLYQYTLMPNHMMGRFCVEELHTAQWVKPFSFTKGCNLIRTECRPWGEESGFAYGLGGYMYPDHLTENLLFDLESDPGQECPLNDAQAEEKMISLLKDLMRENDAPAEQYVRLGLN